MSTSVGTKAAKKQSSLLPDNAGSIEGGREMENALLSLESACISILENQFPVGRQNTERRYWQQRFINIATPVSLALMECKGPRHFHYHYRHRPDDESVLHPVLENPLEMLAQVCRDALKQCQKELVGIEDDMIVEMKHMLEGALAVFLGQVAESAST